MYYVKPDFLSNEIEHFGLPKFDSELNSYFTLIPSRYLQSIQNYSSELGFRFEFLIPMNKGFSQTYRYQVIGIKIIYDINKDSLGLKTNIEDSAKFTQYKKSEFNSKKFNKPNDDAFTIFSAHLPSQRIIIVKPNAQEQRTVIDNILLKKGIPTLDDILKSDELKKLSSRRLTANPY